MANKRLAEIRKTSLHSNVTLVAVHVRRGDRINNPYFHTLYKTASVSYLKSAMKYFRDSFTSPLFVVASDSLNWCKENLGNISDVNFISGTVEEDFAILSSCDHAIITVGSFSWWVGWMTGGKVVYFPDHANHSSYIYQHLTKADYFKPDWIALD